MNPEHPPDIDEIRGALETLLADREFARNAALATFLKFVVEETLAGRGARLKAYTIATLAFRRSDDFNPQVDLIVRVQAQRLRDLLQNYYFGNGAEATVRIVMDRGSYVPRFERAPPWPSPATTGDPAEPAADRSAARGWRTFTSRALFALIAFAGVAIYSGLNTLEIAGPAAPTREAMPPIVAVRAPQLIGTFAKDDTAPGQLMDTIFNGLSSIDYIVLRGRESSDAAADGVDYFLDCRFIRSLPGLADVEIVLTHRPDGRIVWSRVAKDIDLSDKAAIATLGASIVAMAGGIEGATFADIREHLGESDAPLEGFRCRLAGVEYARLRAETQRVAVRNCLKTEIAAHPDEVAALTLLSTILVLSYLDAPAEGAGRADLNSALALAQHAYDVAPRRANSVAALAYARFFSNSYDDGIQGSLEAVAMSPSSSLITLRAGRLLISRGRYDEGVALLKQSEGSNSGLQATAVAFLGLAAHMQGNFDLARAEADRIVSAFTPLGLTLRILACDKVGDAACVAAASLALHENFGGYARDVPAALDRYGLADDIKANLIRGLLAAKFDPAPMK